MKKSDAQPGFCLENLYVGGLWPSIVIYERKDKAFSWHLSGIPVIVNIEETQAVIVAIEQTRPGFRSAILVVLPDRIGWIELGLK